MSEERAILLINLKPPYELKASTLRLASPFVELFPGVPNRGSFLLGDELLVWDLEGGVDFTEADAALPSLGRSWLSRDNCSLAGHGDEGLSIWLY